MTSSRNPQLAAGMSRVLFTLTVDDVEKCFDDKKVLRQIFHRGNPNDPYSSGFQFEFGFDENSCSGQVQPFQNKTVFIYKSKVTVYDENMKLLISLNSTEAVDPSECEVKSDEVMVLTPHWLRSELKAAKGLRLEVDIIFGDERCALPITTKKRDHKLNKDMQDLYEKAEATDVTINVGEEQIKAHKHVLKARSDYFATMFESGMEESQTNLVEINDADPEIFKEMIKFLYSGLLPKHIDAIAMDLLPIADRYKVEALKEMCEATLRRNLSVENLIESLMLAETYNCKDLVASCIPLFKEHLKDLRDGDKWKEMRRYPDLILKVLASFVD